MINGDVTPEQIHFSTFLQLLYPANITLLTSACNEVPVVCYIVPAEKHKRMYKHAKVDIKSCRCTRECISFVYS